MESAGYTTARFVYQMLTRSSRRVIILLDKKSNQSSANTTLSTSANFLYSYKNISSFTYEKIRSSHRLQFFKQEHLVIYHPGKTSTDSEENISNFILDNKIKFFEVEVLEAGADGMIAVGFGDTYYDLNGFIAQWQILSVLVERTNVVLKTIRKVGRLGFLIYKRILLQNL